MRVTMMFVLLLAALGLPVTGWAGVGVLAVGMGVAVAGDIERRPMRWALALALAVCAIAGRGALPVTTVHQGHNVFAPGSADVAPLNALPAAVSAHLQTAWRAAGYPEAGPFDWTTDRLFAWEPESLWRPTPLSREVRRVDFETPLGFRIGAYNSTQYNTFGGQQPERRHLPTYFRFDVPPTLDEARVCWTGTVFWPDAEGALQPIRQAVPGCRAVGAGAAPLTFWAVSAAPEAPLALRIEKSWLDRLWDGLYDMLGIGAGLGVLVLLTAGLDRRKAALVVASVGVTAVGMFFASTQAVVDPSGFVLMEGGNDGLVHAGFARHILAAAAAGDWSAALMGGEPVFDFQAGYRYLLAVNFAVFGNTLFGPLLLVALLPFTVYRLVSLVLGRAWAVGLIPVFMAVPVLEAFGFFYPYYLKELAKGFAEPVAYLCFFVALIWALPLWRGRAGTAAGAVSSAQLMGIGLVCAVAVALRANLAPGVAVFLLAVGLTLVLRWQPGRAAALTAGFMPIGLIPLHNWVYGTPETFFWLTRSATRPFNRGAAPADYVQGLRDLFTGQLDSQALATVQTHLTAEMKPTEPWFHLVLALCAIMTVRPGTDVRLRVVGLTALAFQSLILFYYVGGRYGYLAWTLTVLVALACVADVIVPRLVSSRRRDAVRGWWQRQTARLPRAGFR